MNNDTKYNSSPAKSSATPTQSKAASSRGVENPIAEDAALIGDTRHELATKPLPRLSIANNYGALEHAGPDPNQFRVDCGDGVKGEL